MNQPGLMNKETGVSSGLLFPTSGIHFLSYPILIFDLPTFFKSVIAKYVSICFSNLYLTYQFT